MLTHGPTPTPSIDQWLFPCMCCHDHRLDAEGSATSVVLGGANTEGWPEAEEGLAADAERAVQVVLAMIAKFAIYGSRV